MWYVHIPYMHSALFVHDAIFPHCTLNHCLLKRQDYRKVELWESTQKGLENGEEREALLARPRLIIDGVLRDSATNGEPCGAQCTERSACVHSNHRGLCDSANIHYIYRHAFEETVLRSGVTGNPMEYTYLY